MLMVLIIIDWVICWFDAWLTGWFILGSLYLSSKIYRLCFCLDLDTLNVKWGLSYWRCSFNLINHIYIYSNTVCQNIQCLIAPCPDQVRGSIVKQNVDPSRLVSGHNIRHWNMKIFVRYVMQITIHIHKRHFCNMYQFVDLRENAYIRSILTNVLQSHMLTHATKLSLK